jgi:hypothetical protein
VIRSDASDAHRLSLSGRLLKAVNTQVKQNDTIDCAKKRFWRPRFLLPHVAAQCADIGCARAMYVQLMTKSIARARFTRAKYWEISRPGFIRHLGRNNRPVHAEFAHQTTSIAFMAGTGRLNCNRVARRGSPPSGESTPKRPAGILRPKALMMGNSRASADPARRFGARQSDLQRRELDRPIRT